MIEDVLRLFLAQPFLGQIGKVFRVGMPAIQSTHRVLLTRFFFQMIDILTAPKVTLLAIRFSLRCKHWANISTMKPNYP
jgi:hypothetical protein